MFAPIRPRHLDEHLWENPYEYDPMRFEGEEGACRKAMLVTFSDGLRTCPAKHGFTEMVFKTIIATFFKEVLHFQLDKEVENIPTFSINTSWAEDYRVAVFEMKKCKVGDIFSSTILSSGSSARASHFNF